MWKQYIGKKLVATQKSVVVYHRKIFTFKFEVSKTATSPSMLPMLKYPPHELKRTTLVGMLSTKFWNDNFS